MTELLRVWDRQPSDTPKSYAAFTKYMQMPVYGEEGEKRTLKNLARLIGHSTEKQVAEWSAKFNWQERIAAYDTYMGSKEITLREVAIEEYQKAHITRSVTQVVVLSQIIEKRMAMILKAVQSEIPVDTMDIQRLVNAANQIDIMGRRAAGMPTTFTTREGDEVDYETQVYTIGGE